MSPEMDETTAKKLRALHDDARLSQAEERLQTGWYPPGPYECLECLQGIRKPRLLRAESGKKFVTLTWCSQECLVKWRTKFHLPGIHYKWVDAEGNLKGFYIPKRGYVPLEAIDTDEQKEASA